MRRIKSSGPLGMELTGQFIEEKCDSVGLVRKRGGLDHPGELGNLAHQREFGRVVQASEVRGRQKTCARLRSGRQVEHLAGVTEHRLAAGVPVLHVEYRVVA